MLVIPAIDVKGGKCVRLTQGDYAQETIYAEDPTQVALRWQNKGAKYIHVVDLDGALEGKLINFKAIQAMTMDLLVPFEYGGGLRDFESVEKALSLGADRVVLGTMAYESEEFLADAVREFKKRVIVSIDAKGGIVAVSGWTESTSVDPIFLAKQVKKMGVSAIVYTDILSDGMLKGPNFKAIESLLDSVKMPVIVAGGVSKKEDVQRLKTLEPKGVVGAIVGKALYTGDIKLEEVI
ncbi:MAG: 1-(5-phosphoribosyl)-5-[(5-phosphoribosylamino)methylideneamino]imidazole-4-carboxamide isomerase [Chlamydiae bacterium]|nr:1-(5-phosphoribosyl)-5-[(5-phosphoribosylamino)methylideneamino]imidazole-4-carboxamide isomerase [Chlamydiota bacterium]MBI3277529.1 1-(5-phosphoribosyl)-5-[(5-phosphoribosylamino)methylideneamino]imidazole-4-carboxamide isomerase [Chlamydiota bacterium]